MIQVNISEVKNRLSYYLRLVRGGEQIEILDRETPVALLTHVSKAVPDESKPVWIKEMERLSIVSAPGKKGFPQKFLARKSLPSFGKRQRPEVLKALLEERDRGR